MNGWTDGLMNRWMKCSTDQHMLSEWIDKLTTEWIDR